MHTQLAANIVMTFDFERLAGLSGFFLEISTSTSASLLSESVLVLPLEWLSSGVRSSSPAAIARIEGAHRSDDHNNASAKVIVRAAISIQVKSRSTMLPASDICADSIKAAVAALLIIALC